MSMPFHEGYLAAVRDEPCERCPYPQGELRAAVWREGWLCWLMDLACGGTPPSWRIRA